MAAGNRSYYGIETDVHVTADGHFVVIHGDRTGKVSDVDLCVEESSWEELSKVRLYSRGRTVFPTQLDLDSYYKVLTEERVAELHACGIEVNVWTCDDPAVAEELIRWGVDYITSNILE